MRIAFGRRGCALVMVGVLAAATAAGCGGGDDDGATAAKKPTATSAPSDTNKVASDVQSRSAEAGAAAGKAAGEVKQVPSGKKVGFLQIVEGIESADRVANQVELASKALGWQYTLCDSAGDPTKMATCASTLLSQNVDVIFTDIGDAAPIASSMRKARARKIPVIDVSGEAQGFDANYAPEEKRLGQLLAKYLVDKLDSVDGTAKIAVSEFPQPFAQERTDALEEAIKGNDKLKIVARTTVDPANVIGGSKKTSTDQLTQNPDLKAFWVDFDTAGQAIGQLVNNRFRGKTFPDRPLVATFHADLGTVKLMRDGAVDVVADVAYDASSWMGMDQLLQLWTRDTPLSKERRPTYPGAGDLYTYQIIDQGNLPPAGQYAEPKIDAEAYFRAKWKEEFGI